MAFERQSTAIVHPDVDFPDETGTEKEDGEDGARFRQPLSDVNDGRIVRLSMHTHTGYCQCQGRQEQQAQCDDAIVRRRVVQFFRSPAVLMLVSTESEPRCPL